MSNCTFFCTRLLLSIKKAPYLTYRANVHKVMCGELGIRTPGPFNKSTVFKTAAIDHSASSPGSKVQIRNELANLILTFFY